MSVNPTLAEAADLFFEAAVTPALLPRALDGFARAIGSRGAMLATPIMTPALMPISPGLNESSHAFFEDGWHLDASRTKRGAKHAARGVPGFMSDHDLFTEEELKTLPYYRGFARKHDVPWFCAGLLLNNANGYVAISLNRRDREGAFTQTDKRRLNAILPRMRQAALLAEQAGSLRSDGMLDSFDLLGTAACLLSEGGAVRRVNAEADRLFGKLIHLRRNRLQVGGQQTQREIDQMIAAVLSHDERARSAAAKAVIIRDEDDHPRLIARAIPLFGVAHDVYQRASALVLLTQIGSRPPLPELLLQSAFRLTSGEARVARLLLDGMAPDLIGGTLGITRETVRFYIKSILMKSNTHRQSEFIWLASQLVSVQIRDR